MRRRSSPMMRLNKMFAATWNARRPVLSRGFSLRPSSPQIVDGPEVIVGVEGNVFEAAFQRVVMALGGPIDTQGRVDGGLNIFRAHVAVGAPAGFERVEAEGVGLSDRAAAPDSGAGEQRGLLQEMIAAGVRVG